MPVINVPLPSNPDSTYELLEVNGRLFPFVYNEVAIKNIPHLKLRDDDVLICGYLRSGTHWTFEILNMLMSGSLETVPERKESLHLEQTTQEKIDTFPYPRVLSSHLLFHDLPGEVIGRKTKIIYLVRDPRDCLASWYTCLSKIFKENQPRWRVSFSDYLELNFNRKTEWGDWFENIESWERALEDHPDHPIHLVYYEELLQNTVAEISKMANFLQVGRDVEFCRLVADKTRLEKMMLDKDKYTEKFAGKIVHYNKGIVGNWKTMFTVSMMEKFDQLYERKMEGSNFRDRYSRNAKQSMQICQNG